MNSSKQYSTPKDQIRKLKSQKLFIENENDAEKSLELFGYFNLIKGYRDPYIITSGNSITYRDGVSFEQICSLYLLDKNLRNAVIAAMLDFEEHLKETVADVLAKSFGTDHHIYLKYSNFQNKKKKNAKFSLSKILSRINDTLESDKDPIFHYVNVYNSVPPWVLLKVQFFGNVVNLVDQMKAPQQELLFSKLYPVFNGSITKDHLQFMRDTLFICYEYRNIAAHGGRVYNHICNAKFRQVPFIKISPMGFSQFLELLTLMDYKGPVNRLKNILNNELSRHCSKYPQDITYLSSILNINIQLTKHVFIKNGSSIFHADKRCSGMKTCYEIDYDEAIKMGLRPCKRCFSGLSARD